MAAAMKAATARAASAFSVIIFLPLQPLCGVALTMREAGESSEGFCRQARNFYW
jgi:hypothetical protein